jgi:hypothetical protein
MGRSYQALARPPVPDAARWHGPAAAEEATALPPAPGRAERALRPPPAEPPPSHSAA